VQASLRVRDLLVASWETDRESVENAVPRGLEVLPTDGSFVVTLAAFHVEGGRVGRFPVPPYTQVNVRTPVAWNDEAAVFFVAARVTAGGLPAVLLGAPFRYGRLHVREGRVEAPGRGISINYRVAAGLDPGPQPELGLYENDGLREFRISRGETAWQRAELVAPAELDFLVALGFHPRGEPELIYATRSSFAFEVPKRPKAGKDPYD
jgi:Uncharacterized conserved protein (COG2071)